MLKLPLGLKENKLWGVDHVGGGLTCQCICPGCKQPLVARKGKKKAHHFAHYQIGECNSGLETTLHLLAKTLLKQARCIVLPPLICNITDRILKPAKKIHFDHIKTEVRLGNFTPDLVVEVGNHRLLLEIGVTHFCPSAKLERLEERGEAVLEINAGAIMETAWKTGQIFDVELFKTILLYKPDHKEWLFHPGRAAWESRLFDGAEVKKVKRWSRGARKSYWVNGCPEKHLTQADEEYWHGGNAGVFSDCIHCPYCLEVLYHEDRRGGHGVKTYPLQVICGAREFKRLVHGER